MRDIVFDDFAGKTGAAYDIEIDGGSVPLTLSLVEPLPDSGREGGSFRLEFRGPAEPVLPQAIYPFGQGPEAFEIFIVPIGRKQDGTLYEAIFF